MSQVKGRVFSSYLGPKILAIQYFSQPKMGQYKVYLMSVFENCSSLVFIGSKHMIRVKGLREIEMVRH